MRGGRHTRSIIERMDVVLLGEPFAKRSLERTQIGDGELQNLGRPLPGYEECGLWVLVLLRLALRHCALCAGILGFSDGVISSFLWYWP